MPRIRTLKPEHRQHRKVGPLDHLTYRLWVGMILEADDEGRLVADPAQLRTQIVPYHTRVTLPRISASLRVLNVLGLCLLYDEGGTQYAWFPDWHDHQRINKPQKSRLPPHPNSGNGTGILPERSRITTVGTEVEGKGSGKEVERKGRESEGRETVDLLRIQNALRAARERGQ